MHNQCEQSVLRNYFFAYDTKLLLQTPNIVSADLAGHSLGSIVAQIFAEVWPESTPASDLDLIDRP
ncbi:MAG: hypothetical protein ABJC66_12525 [Gammaproteobacteria bacterium]